MRTVLLCTALVFLSAATASAQFNKNSPPARGEKKPPAEANGTTAGEKNAAGADKVADAAALTAAHANKLFAALDLDGDGIISKVELRKAIVSLKKLDADNDGQLTMVECGITDANGQPVAEANSGANANGAANNPNGNAAGANGAGNAAFTGRNNDAMGLFLQMDANHDGKLSRDEVPQQMLPMLAHADLNGDGFIDANEFQAAAKKMGERMRAGYAAGMNAGAANGGRRP
ncbi:MAG TPA: hypothetical protein VH107_21545 [Lacipirellulaceae bacterium]|jgi:Ca2+-binding EF-hand superfamily protein|nr:hypothetical protein [Lacipirellulaceae bacterium]